MPHFKYHAYLKNGIVEKGITEAANQKHAIQQLAKNEKKVFFIQDKNSIFEPSLGISINSRKINALRFITDLSILINAGLNADLAMKALSDSEQEKSQKQLYGSIIDELSNGESLFNACTNLNFLESDSIALIAAGEQSGKLGSVLNMLSQEMKLQSERKRKLVEALLYPCFLIVMVLLALGVITFVLVPALEPIFTSGGKPVPFLLNILSKIRSALINNAVAVSIGVATFTLILMMPYFRKLSSGIFNSLKFNTPLIGPALLNSAKARYLFGLSLLLKNNVSVPQSLQLSADCCPTLFLRPRLLAIKESVIAGEKISVAIEQSSLFEAGIVSIIKVGDEVNRLDITLEKAADILSAKSSKNLERFATFLTPAITIFLGLVIGTLAVSVMSALLGINDLAN